MTIALRMLAPKHEYGFGGGWCRKVELNGVVYIVGVERGKAVRIAFKPRGQNRGYHWWGFVRSEKGRDIWHGQVPKSLGVRGLLTDAGLIPRPKKPPLYPEGSPFNSTS